MQRATPPRLCLPAMPLSPVFQTWHGVGGERGLLFPCTAPHALPAPRTHLSSICRPHSLWTRPPWPTTHPVTSRVRAAFSPPHPSTCPASPPRCSLSPGPPAPPEGPSSVVTAASMLADPEASSNFLTFLEAGSPPRRPLPPSGIFFSWLLPAPPFSFCFRTAPLQTPRRQGFGGGLSRARYPGGAGDTAESGTHAPDLWGLWSRGIARSSGLVHACLSFLTALLPGDVISSHGFKYP